MVAGSEQSRRGWLLSVAAAMMAGCGERGCGKRSSPAQGVDPSVLDIQEIDFSPAEGGPQKAVVIVPRWGGPGARYPLLIALHGRGESNRGLDVGARGWTRDYYLDRAMMRIRRPPLTRDDLFRIGSDRYLAELNDRIAKRPFRGLVVACPYTPDILATRALDAAEPFAAFLVDRVVPRLRATFPVEPSARATGIDGVSLGGRVALLAGLSRIESFGAIGTLQPAIREPEVERIADIAADAFACGRPVPLRLLTSEDDPFRPSIQALAEAMDRRGLHPRYVSIEGPHDYVFNQGPGGYEMLAWHDQVLRGEEG